MAARRLANRPTKGVPLGCGLLCRWGPLGAGVLEILAARQARFNSPKPFVA